MTYSTGSVLVQSMTFHSTYATEEEIKNAATNVEKSADVIKAIAEVGKNSFDFVKDETSRDNMKRGLEALIGVADIVRGIVKLVPGPDSDLLIQLRRLGDKIQNLGKQLNKSFDQMEAYITERSFFMNLVNPTLVMMKYLRDCINNPGQLANQNFEEAYKKNLPLQLARNLNRFLKDDALEPINRALNTEKAKAKETYLEWQDTISRLLKSFLVLEAFSYNQKITRDLHHNTSKLEEEAKVTIEILSGLEENFDKEGKYWEEVRKFVDILPVTASNKKEMADKVKQKLDSYLTKDAFYVCVFNNGQWNQSIFYQCPDKQSQTIFHPQHQACVLVYRSREAFKLKKDQYDDIEKKVRSFERRAFLDFESEKIINDQLFANPVNLRNDTFILLVDKNNGVEVRGVNCPGHEKGPGYWKEIEGGDGHSKMLVVGLP